MHVNVASPVTNDKIVFLAFMDQLSSTLGRESRSDGLGSPEKFRGWEAVVPCLFAGLIFARLFAWMAVCLQLNTGRRRVRLVKALKPTLLHLPPRIGAWCWQRKGNQPRLRRRSKSFAALTGGHCTDSSDAKAISQRKHRISLKLFLRGCSNEGI